uniref:Lysozyme n=1 Tax=Plectus sambesii TaxID=2011161 RepID=A0A914WP51_9BILA
MRLSWFSLLILAHAANAYIGLDGIQTMSVNAFHCLASQGYSFYVTRVYSETGHVDLNGVNNVKAGRAAGWRDVDGYIYPSRRAGSPSATQQMKDTIDTLNSQGAVIGMIWLDIERDPEWSSDLGVNQQVIRDLVKQAEAMGKKVGIYTNNNNWAAIVGINWSEFSSLPLWWANYNGQQNYDGFVPFGGWTRPAIHQYKGTTSGPCGVSMDLNYYP